MKRGALLAGMLVIVLMYASAGYCYGTNCDNAEVIKQDRTISDYLDESDTHFYKVWVPKGCLLVLTLNHDTSVGGILSMQLRAHGWYDGTQWNCSTLLQSDCSPVDKNKKRLLFIANIEGYYVVCVNSVYGGHGDYKLRTEVVDIRVLAN